MIALLILGGVFSYIAIGSKDKDTTPQAVVEEIPVIVEEKPVVEMTPEIIEFIEAEKAVQVKCILLITHVELRRTNLFLTNDVIEEEKRNSLDHFLFELILEISSSY